MAVTDPDRYLDPAKYEAYIAAFLQGGNTEEEARLNLKRTGFNLPGEEAVSETMTDTAIPEPGTTGAGPELEQWKSLMDPDLPMPTEQGFQQAGTEVEESLTEVEGMRPIQEYAQGLMDKNPLPGAADERPLFQRLMTAGARQNLKHIPSKKVEPEPEPKVEEAALVQEEMQPKDEEGETKPGTETETEPDAYQISLWQEEVGAKIIDPKKKEIFDTEIEFINELEPPEGGFRFFGNKKDDYELVLDKINEGIDKYETSIQDIAQEKQKPPLEGGNMWLAILGVALGAAGSALTRTPNEAMQMLESFLDREQQKFLKSKEMRMKSADQQRLDLIRRRGELLQQFQNETKRVLQISEFQLKKTEALAVVKKIQEELQQKLDQNSIDNQIQVAKIIRDVVISHDALRGKMSAEERKGIAPNMGTNPGEVGVSMLRGAGRDKVMKQVVDFNAVYGEVSRAVATVEDIIEKDKQGALSPEALSAARSNLVQRVTQIKLNAAKKLYQFGAALTLNEEKLLDQIIGDAKRMNVALGITETRLKNFMDIMEDKRQSLREAGGFTTLGGTTGVENRKPNRGVTKTHGGKRHQRD